MRWIPSEKILSLKDFTIPQLRLFLKGYPGDWRDDPDDASGKPPPPITKPAPESSNPIALPSPSHSPAMQAPYGELVENRRSCRSFGPAPLSLEEVSFLLWSTQAILAMVRTENGEIDHHFRPVPSGGARHPFETYILAERIDGLPPGLFRYLPGQHALLPLGCRTNAREEIKRSCYDQAVAATAAALFVWAAVPYRSEWRFGYLAHRMIAIEAGHVCQNFLLSAEALRLGACPLLGYDQPSMDKLIEVDGVNEFAVYLAATGPRP